MKIKKNLFFMVLSLFLGMSAVSCTLDDVFSLVDDLKESDLSFKDFLVNDEKKYVWFSDPGGSLTVKSSVINQGLQDIKSGKIKYYLSRDKVFGAADQYLGDKNIPFLVPGVELPDYKKLTLPTNGGTYYYGMCIDLGEQYKVEFVINCQYVFEVTVAQDLSSVRVSGRQEFSSGLKAGGIDIYRFQVLKSKNYTIEAISDDDIIGSLSESLPEEGVCLSEGDDKGSDKGFKFTKNLTSDGNKYYYICVKGKTEQVSGDYLLKVY